jgi:hypothetical protein
LGNARFGRENRQAAARNRAALRHKPEILAAGFCHDQFFRASLEHARTPGVMGADLPTSLSGLPYPGARRILISKEMAFLLELPVAG